MARGETAVGLPAQAVTSRPGGGGGGLAAWAREARRWVVERSLVLATGLVAAVPIIVSMIARVVVPQYPDPVDPFAPEDAAQASAQADASAGPLSGLRPPPSQRGCCSRVAESR